MQQPCREVMNGTRSLPRQSRRVVDAGALRGRRFQLCAAAGPRRADLLWRLGPAHWDLAAVWEEFAVVEDPEEPFEEESFEAVPAEDFSVEPPLEESLDWEPLVPEGLEFWPARESVR